LGQIGFLFVFLGLAMMILPAPERFATT